MGLVLRRSDELIFLQENKKMHNQALQRTAIAVAELERYMYNSMKKLLFLSLLIILLAGCRKTVPTMRRTSSGVLFDKSYMEKIFVPSVKDKEISSALQGQLKELDKWISEFRMFMAKVESGNIKVVENPKGGLWQSVLRREGYYFMAYYPGNIAPVSQFNKRRNQDPHTLIYSLWFHPNGHLKWARTRKEGLVFDDTGKIRSFWFETPKGTQEVSVGQDGNLRTRFWAKKK